MGKSKATSNSLTDLLAVTKQTTNFINLVTSIAKDIDAITEHNYKLLNLELDKIKGKSVKEVVGSIVGVATSMMARIKTDYDIFDIGNEITRYEAVLTQYRDLIPNKALLANVEKALEEFRHSLKAVYRTSRASEAYQLIMGANDLLRQIDILGYSLAQVEAKKANREEVKTDTANKPKSKQGRKKVKKLVSIEPTVVAIETEPASTSEATKPKRGRPKKSMPTIPPLTEETIEAIATETEEAIEVVATDIEETVEAVVTEIGEVVEAVAAPVEIVIFTSEVTKPKRGRPKKSSPPPMPTPMEVLVEGIVIAEAIIAVTEEAIEAMVRQEAKYKPHVDTQTSQAPIVPEEETSNSRVAESAKIIKTPVQWKGKGSKDTSSTQSPEATKTKEKVVKIKEKALKPKERTTTPSKRGTKAKATKASNIEISNKAKVRLVKAKKNWEEPKPDVSEEADAKGNAQAKDANDNK